VPLVWPETVLCAHLTGAVQEAKSDFVTVSGSKRLANPSTRKASFREKTLWLSRIQSFRGYVTKSSSTPGSGSPQDRPLCGPFRPVEPLLKFTGCLIIRSKHCALLQWVFLK